VPHPDWVHRRLRQHSDPARQLSIREIFAAAPAADSDAAAAGAPAADEAGQSSQPMDIEDLGGAAAAAGAASGMVQPIVRKRCVCFGSHLLVWLFCSSLFHLRCFVLLTDGAA
jgi:hypothetical protein